MPDRMDLSIIPGYSSNSLDRIEYELSRDPRLKSECTFAGYRHDLHSFNEWRSRRPITKLLVEEYAAHLQNEAKSPRSINRALAAIRWWTHKLVDLAYEDVALNQAQREAIIAQAARAAQVKDVRGKREKPGRWIASTEEQSILSICTNDRLRDGRRSPSGVRDAMIFTLAWNTGMRRSEIIGLRVSDITQAHGKWWEVLVRGKGDKERKVPISGETVRRLREWMALRGRWDGPLFCAINKGGRIARKGLTDEALAKMLKKRIAQAGLSKSATWHDFRRTFASNLFDRGADIVTIQGMLGHASPATTSGYDRRDGRAKERAIEQLMETRE
jgi:site-specific recombinase XerD